MRIPHAAVRIKGVDQCNKFAVHSSFVVRWRWSFRTMGTDKNTKGLLPMRVLFNEEMKQIADDLDTMAAAVKAAIDGAGKALLDNDIDAAQSVIDGDLKIDGLEASIIDQCVQMLAKQSPVATDLRIVISTLRIASTFERMGDLARHIAETARRAYPDSAVNPAIRDLFEKMQDFDSHTAGEIISILQNRDEDRAEKLIVNDNTLDELHTQTFSIINSEDWKGTQQQTIDAVLIARFYERIGDHAVGVARRIVYMVSGFDPSKDPTPQLSGSLNE